MQRLPFAAKINHLEIERNDDSVKNEERFNYALVTRTQDRYLTPNLQYGIRPRPRAILIRSDQEPYWKFHD